MLEKKPKTKRPKDFAKLSQRQKFIAAAKMVETEKSGAQFLQALGKVLVPRPKTRAL
jgi:hypothetical protein